MQQRSSSSARHSGRTASPAICLSGARARRRTCCGSGRCCARSASGATSRCAAPTAETISSRRARRCAECSRRSISRTVWMRPAACTSCRRTPLQTWRRPQPSVPAWRTHAARCRCCPRRATGGQCPPAATCAGTPTARYPSPDCRRARGATCSRTGASAFLRPTRARGICGIATRTPGASTAGCATRGCCAARRRCAWQRARARYRSLTTTGAHGWNTASAGRRGSAPWTGCPCA